MESAAPIAPDPTAPDPATLDQTIAFDPAADFDALLKDVPAKWAIYLMSDAEQRPVQLLCVKNLRYSIRRRLGPPDELQPPGKRVDYRQIVRHVAWRRVDSAFEADWLYLEAARRIFPQTYQGMTGLRPAWFIHVNPDAPFPRYVKTHDLSSAAGTFLGPLEDKHAAAHLIEDVTDWFDLCRYYNVLVEAPAAKACAYKEMGKCPAPCDGSIGMDQYRRLVDWSMQTLIDPVPHVRDQQRRMQAAAAELRFENAAKIKTYVDSLSKLGKGAYRHLRRLEDFVFVSLQRGPRARTAKMFVITPGQVQEICALLGEPPAPICNDLLRLALERAQPLRAARPDVTAAERIGIVAHHLFAAKQTSGVFIPLDQADEKTVAKAYRDLLKQPEPPEHPGEGVVKDLGVI